MTTYGSTPGVKITEGPGNFTDVEIGREQYLVFVGVGTSNATAQANEVINFREYTEVGGFGKVTNVDTSPVGEDSDIAYHVEEAVDEGANIDYLRGLMAETQESDEVVSSATGTLSTTSFVPSLDRISAEDDSTGDAIDVAFHYEDPLETPDDATTIFVNPYTGDYAMDPGAPTVNITVEKVFWDQAIKDAVYSLKEGDFGTIVPLTADPDAIASVDKHLDDVRTGRFGMGLGLCAATPNATADDGHPEIDITSYTLPKDANDEELSSDHVFLFGPTQEAGMNPTRADYGVESLGRITGRIVSSAVGDPVYDDTFGDLELHQNLTRGQVDAFRNKRLVPLRDTGELVRIEDNQSTYEWTPAEDWERDMFRRQIVDLTVLAARQIGRNSIGTVLDDGTVADAQENIIEEMESLEERGLLQPGGQNVTVSRADNTTLDVALRITPYGVTKAVTVDLTVDR